MGALVRMSLNMLILLAIFSFAITGGNTITLEEILQEIEVLKYDNQLLQKNVTELSARIEACEAQNQQQDITIEHNAESASTERDIITIHVHDNALGLADNIQRTVDLRKDLSELEVGTQTDLNQLNETIFEAVTKTQNELNRTQEVLIPGVGSILPWIPSPSPRDNSSLSATIPSGWQRCDGSLILEGQFTGLTTPNLNGERYFLRGGDDFSVTLMEADMVQDHVHDFDDPGHTHSTSRDGDTETAYPVADDDWKSKTKTGASHRDSCFETQGSDCETWYFDTADDHSHSVYSAKTQVTVGLISSSNSTNKGFETRPKNMAVIYIMRIF